MSDFQIIYQIFLLRKNFTLLKYLSEFLMQFDFTKIFSQKICEKYVKKIRKLLLFAYYS